MKKIEQVRRELNEYKAAISKMPEMSDEQELYFFSGWKAAQPSAVVGEDECLCKYGLRHCPVHQETVKQPVDAREAFERIHEGDYEGCFVRYGDGRTDEYLNEHQQSEWCMFSSGFKAALSQAQHVKSDAGLVEAADYYISGLYNASIGIPVRDLDERKERYIKASEAHRKAGNE